MENDIQINERLTLCGINQKNATHMIIVRKMLKDRSITGSIGDFEIKMDDIMTERESYIGECFLAKYNGEYIGYISITDSPIREHIKSLDYAIMSEYRGNLYGAALLYNVSNYLIENNPDINYIGLIINEDNIHSINAAKEAGFKKTVGRNIFYNYQKINPHKKKCSQKIKRTKNTDI